MLEHSLPPQVLCLTLNIYLVYCIRENVSLMHCIDFIYPAVTVHSNVGARIGSTGSDHRLTCTSSPSLTSATGGAQGERKSSREFGSILRLAINFVLLLLVF